jgi:hypothetical protein
MMMKRRDAIGSAILIHGRRAYVADLRPRADVTGYAILSGAEDVGPGRVAIALAAMTAIAIVGTKVR